MLSEIGDRLESGPDAVLMETKALARTGLVYLNTHNEEAAEDCLLQVLEVYEKHKKQSTWSTVTHFASHLL